jgi:hypothetical protein
MKDTHKKLESQLIAELVQIEKRRDYLNTRLDEVTLELRDIEEKRRVISQHRSNILSELERLGVVV